MNREHFETLIDDYLDGDLAAAARREIETLAATEPWARRLLDDRRRLLDDLGGLARDTPPGRDLWPAVAAATRRRPPWAPALLAAGLAIAALGAAWLLRTPAAGPQAELTVAPAPAGARPAARRAVLEAEQALLDAKDELRAALAGRRAALPPETLRQVDANLEIIEAAIAEISEAIATDPGNEELQRTLVAYHQRELGLLERATRAAARM